MKSYEVTSDEGANYAKNDDVDNPVVVGDSVKLDLSKDEETALIAAGWLAEPAKKKEG